VNGKRIVLKTVGLGGGNFCGGAVSATVGGLCDGQFVRAAVLRWGQKSHLQVSFKVSFGMNEHMHNYLFAVDFVDNASLPYQSFPEVLEAQESELFNVRSKQGICGDLPDRVLEEVMAVVTECFRPLEVDCPRISSQIKIDFRAGTSTRMKSKVEKVESLLGRKLST
jgi:hypothetical protein